MVGQRNLMMDPKADAQAGYPELYVGPTCHVQTAASRFGSDVVEDIKAFVFQGFQINDMASDDDDDDDDDDDEYDDENDGDAEMYDSVEGAFAGLGPESDHSHGQHPFPQIASRRCNLTALSQRYNLYFAAYQDRVYVFQPRRAPRILPPPSLILHPRPSKLALCYGGEVDPSFPHQINHIKVGNLGNLEIVLFAYDDGDVTAYYTHAIANYIVTIGDQAHTHGGANGHQPSHPKALFHENVGRSAWGLAVHERSRLIAVGSNLHEVTVFAFAFREKAAAKFPKAVSFPSDCSGQAALERQRYFPARTRTWRITLPLGPGGHNIPDIAFIDDEAGEADKVVAVDIRGNAWLLDIWKMESCPIQWPDYPIRDTLHNISRGWGVVVLPDSSFRPTRTVREALGLPGNEIVSPKQKWLDTTCSLYYIKELAPDPGSVLMHRTQYDYAGVHSGKRKGGFALDDDQYMSETDSDPEHEMEDSSEPVAADLKAQSTDPWAEDDDYPSFKPFDLSHIVVSGVENVSDGPKLARAVVPSFRELWHLDSTRVHMLFSRASEERQAKTKQIAFAKAEIPAHLARGFCLLRTSLTDIELHPFDQEECGIVCKQVLTSHNRSGVTTSLELHPIAAEQVNMVIHVPELSLVVAGSPVGRVALITPTKTPGKLKHMAVRRGFRVDRVLPRRFEDNLRPPCTLIGIAISPVPNDRGSRLSLNPPRGSTPPVMYRLILHYRDHTILMYDIARGLDDDELMIF